ncbi:hypothetical protein [Piscibacillus salipiscarius]|uniref:hypothetical protein n=1 Tax=Piscibacillus salipiscarius TaxID=299480 RepID=UPI0006D27201|nr:hypothetical protein [Piscibacillus salipiscarius]
MSKNIVNIEIRDYVIRFTEVNPKRPTEMVRFGEHFLPNGIIDVGTIQDSSLFQKAMNTCVKKVAS